MGNARAHSEVYGKAYGVVISVVTAQVARGFTMLPWPGLLGKIGARLHPGCLRYLYTIYR